MRRNNCLRALARLLAWTAALAALVSFAVSDAGAVTDAEFLTQFGSSGAGAGQLGLDYAMDSNPVTGHLYISDTAHNRIDEFTPWGSFVKAFGWDVVPGGGGGLESCTVASGCKAGLGGSGTGQIDNAPFGLAVDAGGDIYVREEINDRVQKFDSAGHFLLMIGGGVDKTTGANVCTEASGDECGSGSEGLGPGQFAGSGAGVAVSSTGTVFVADTERVQEFGPSGEFEAEIPVAGESIRELARDPGSGDLYVTFNSGELFPSKANVRKLSPSGATLGTLEVERPVKLATDAAGDTYVIDAHGAQESEEERVLEFNPGGAKVAELKKTSGGVIFFGALATNTAGDLYVSSTGGGSDYVRAYGPAPVAFEPPPSAPPAIAAEYAVSVGTNDAVLGAEINPHFFQDAKYYVEYGTGMCSEGGCAERQPIPPGAKLTTNAIDGPVAARVLLSGLEPGVAYHFRFVAESSGGGPVSGVGGEVGKAGAEGAFRTFPLPAPPRVPCVNQIFRTGLSGRLPDCRAYEMVSPIEKNNGDIRAAINVTGFDAGLRQGAVNGETFTYSSYRAFDNANAAPYTSQYLAMRGAEGWSSQSLSSPRSSPGAPGLLGNDFQAFSPDLCSAWLVTRTDPPLAPGALEGSPNLYRRENCPASYEALSTVEPLSGEIGVFISLQGYSADGSKAIFRSEGQLTSDASGADQLYETSKGALELVCVLPNGAPFAGACSAGTPTENGSDDGTRTSSVNHAISEDGSRIYWSASDKGPGKLYLRIGGETTLPVSETISPQPAQFWGASVDGARALFRLDGGPKAGTLYEYDVGGEASTPIAGKVLGVVAASADLSYCYFVSEEALGGEGAEGKPNLYLRHEGTSAFIATLSRADVAILGNGAASIPSDVTPEPIYHPARAGGDGQRLAFISTERLTGYDNTDIARGEADSEVYTYDANTKALNCVSCNPSGARPMGRDVQASGNAGVLPTAASMPLGTYQLYTPRVLTEDGNDLFFDSYDALVPRDTNGKEDVYEWERAGSGSCQEADPAFSVANGGCVYLISSGESTSDSELADISTDGRDVFFATNASLLPQDPGLIDIYDARAGGGLPAPQGPPAACEGEACQGSPVPPLDTTPASFAFSGPGNPAPPPLTTVVPKKAKKTAARARAEGLARALKGCRAKPKSKRRHCETAARKRYGAKSKSNAKRSKNATGGGGRS